MDGPGRAKQRTFGFVGLQGYEKLPQQAVFRLFVWNDLIKQHVRTHRRVEAARNEGET